MTTSGTATEAFDLTDLFLEAYELAGIEARTGYQMRSARRSFNYLTLEWANTGINLWTVTSTSTTTVAGTSTYTLPAATMDVLDVMVSDDDIDFVLTRIAGTTYAQITNKALQGRPNEYWVNRTLAPKLILWPVPDAVFTLTYYYVRRIEDAGAYVNTPDIPSRFIPALVMGLAYKLAAKSKGSESRVPVLFQEYQRLLSEAQAEDREKTSLMLVPDMGR